MSQTSTERLRDYLAQLPPQAQALLMREFERAIERGEDAAVANLVLEQLRKVVRGAEEDDEMRPRSDDPARLLFQPLERSAHHEKNMARADRLAFRLAATALEFERRLELRLQIVRAPQRHVGFFH